MNEKILVVEDSEIDLLAIKNKLSEYDVMCARNGEEMWQLLENDTPAIILLDVVMPGKSGFQIAKDLSAVEKFADIPIIFLTSKNTGQDVEEGFKSGCDDYIKKPYNETELKARIRSILKKKENELDLKKKTITDSLTGLYNRKYFFENVDKNIEYYKRNDKKNFSIAVIDLDYFKTINDTYGHQAGDHVLKEFSDILRKRVRPYDIAARYGGEEFIVLFVDCDKERAGENLQRIKDEVEKTIFTYNEHKMNFTFSSGIAEIRDIQTDSLTSEELFKIADERLYMAKQSGRNKIVIKILAR